jgi:hypothetical protein
LNICHIQNHSGYVADEDNDPLEISKEVSESSLPKNVQGRVYSEELVKVVSECRSPQDGQICKISTLAFSNSTFPSLANVILPTFSCM